MSLGALSRWVTTVALFGTIVRSDARAQVAEGVSGYFRNVLADVAKAGRLPRLDSTALGNGVRREIRVYTGFGMGIPSRIVRLWQDDRNVHAQFGVFWPRTANRDDYRAFIDSAYGCRAATRSLTMNVCWLDDRPDHESWNDVLATLDALGIETIQMPADPKTGFDGWMILAEARTRGSYRAYSFWMPDSTSKDPGERAAAKVAAILREPFNRRLPK